MSLADLRAAGAFVAPDPVQKVVRWEHADDASGIVTEYEFAVRIRPQSFAAVQRARYSVGPTALSELIANSILLVDAETGATETLTVEQANDLHPTLATQFILAINEVNGIAKGAARKNLPQMTSSGTS